MKERMHIMKTSEIIAVLFALHNKFPSSLIVGTVT